MKVLSILIFSCLFFLITGCSNDKTNIPNDANMHVKSEKQEYTIVFYSGFDFKNVNKYKKYGRIIDMDESSHSIEMQINNSKNLEILKKDPSIENLFRPATID